MADKDTPDWVVHLITEVTGIKESFKQSFDELNKTINGLKKETRATLSSERNNIVLVGLKEGAEAGDPDRMVEGILRYILDLKVDDSASTHFRIYLWTSRSSEPILLTSRRKCRARTYDMACFILQG
jgi:hypothetical protein